MKAKIEIILEPAQNTDECPHQYGYFKIGDNANCGQFINCAAGRAYVFECPEGLAFHSGSYRCDWPDQVPDCDPEGIFCFFFKKWEMFKIFRLVI